MARSRRNPAVSVATARVIPLLLVLLVAYATYVVLGPLSIQTLLNGPTDIQSIPAGIAIPIVHFLLLIPLGATWLRLLLAVIHRPGYIPQGTGDDITQIWTKDVFACDMNGKPIWCGVCQAWKPDRAHHNQDVARCTAKMDHFCPWVGGVVGERSMKFFIQFLFYATAFTTFTTIVFAYYVARRKVAQWIVVLGLSGFFLFFTMGMLINSLYNAARNVTTIESIGGKGQYLAVVLPPEMQDDAPLSASPNDPTSDFDDPSHLEYFNRQKAQTRRSMKVAKASTIWKSTITYPLALPTDRPPLPAPEPRTFAVLELPAGVNPWDLGTPWRNLAAVLGYSLHEWLIPYKHSPCCDHSSMVSDYPLGPAFEQLLEDACLSRTPQEASASDESPKSKKERKRKLDEGWRNGERPDGWISEKEARRVRHELRRQMRERAREQNGND